MAKVLPKEAVPAKYTFREATHYGGASEKTCLRNSSPIYSITSQVSYRTYQFDFLFCQVLTVPDVISL
ncbi:hypothetical protein HZ326_27763 [Fusarium oxysporum f. sp. albedinis]|nr:hypothetical protein HZ326_27763 [Fusarium oxysporum f. sp. albedinis]